MKNYKKSNKRKNRTRTRSKAGIALLTIVIMGILTFSNILTNKTEAASKDIVDVILFFGQSNMVGSAMPGDEKRQGTTEAEQIVFSKKTGIDLDIVKNIKSRCKVDVPLRPGTAYEYIYNPDAYVKEFSSMYGNATSWNENLTSANGTVWNRKNLKPLEMDNITGENLTGNTSNATIQYTPGGGNTDVAGATNMVPEFCRKYYELTGRKVVAVICAKGGVGIQEFAPADQNGNATGTYVVLSR